MLRLGMAFLALVFASASQASIYLSETGSRAYLSGEIDIGDEKTFEDFLNKARETRIRVIYLSSVGGSVAASLNIGGQIRKAGLATAVQADRALCDSACTMLFAAGVQRYYVKGETVFEGYSARSGLGYHTAHTRDDTQRFGLYSDKGTQSMAAYYRVMGQPRAVELALKASFNSIYRPSGKTALALKIATSLSDPPD